MIKYQLKTLEKLKRKGFKMIQNLDIHDLTEEDVEFLKNIIRLLREKASLNKAKTGEKENINFAS